MPFTMKDVFNQGKPSSRDISQDLIGDCFIMATMGAVADQQPDLIRISYDNYTREFVVPLFKDGKRVEYGVTQAELLDNFRRGGGSTYDNHGSGPIWPAILEVAYAKSLDSNPADGLAEGWKKLDQGGRPIDAMYALTGSQGEALDQAGIDRLGTQKTLQKLRDALAQGQPITLNTITEPGRRQDGLVDEHSYVVQRAFVDGKGEARLELRNPWGARVRNSEGAEPSSIKLDDLRRAGSLAYLNIGPTPAVQKQIEEIARLTSDRLTGDRLTGDRLTGGKLTGDKLTDRPGSLRLIDVLNDMARSINTPQQDAGLTRGMQALRNTPESEEFMMRGRIEVQKTTVQVQSETVRLAPRVSESRTLSIGGM